MQRRTLKMYEIKLDIKNIVRVFKLNYFIFLKIKIYIYYKNEDRY